MSLVRIFLVYILCQLSMHPPYTFEGLTHRLRIHYDAAEPLYTVAWINGIKKCITNNK